MRALHQTRTGRSSNCSSIAHAAHSSARFGDMDIAARRNPAPLSRIPAEPESSTAEHLRPARPALESPSGCLRGCRRCVGTRWSADLFCPASAPPSLACCVPLVSGYVGCLVPARRFIVSPLFGSLHAKHLRGAVIEIKDRGVRHGSSSSGLAGRPRRRLWARRATRMTVGEQRLALPCCPSR